MKNGKKNVQKIKVREPKVWTEGLQLSSQKEKDFASKLITPKAEWNCNYLLKSYMSL